MRDRPQEFSAYNPRQVLELKKLVSRGESGTLEFKRKATYPEKIVREMIAFANTKGGVLLLGIGDDKTIPGLKYPEDESLVVHKALEKCRPRLPVNEHFISLGNARTVIRYDIEESSRKPHYLVAGGQPECFVRVNDQSIRASREVREIIKRSQKKKDIRFYYGEHERFLMQYLDHHPSITLQRFVELSRLNQIYASKKLVLLVLADVLNITPHEKGDLFSLAFGKK